VSYYIAPPLIYPLGFFITGLGGPPDFLVIGIAGGGGPFDDFGLFSLSVGSIRTTFFECFYSLPLLAKLRLVTESSFFCFLYCILRLLLTALNYPDFMLSSSESYLPPSRVPYSSSTVGLDG
jgi:hypothetical protein